MTPEQALIICRFLVDSCALLLWGAHGFLWVGVAPRLAARLQQRLNGTISMAVALLTLATVSKLPVQAAILGNGWPDAINLPLIRDFISTTRSGLALTVQSTLALLLAIAYLLWPTRRIRSMTILAGLTLSSLSISGHAAMNSGLIGLLHAMNDSLHVLAVGAWVGALAPVLLLLATPTDNKAIHASTQALMRFSTLGHGAVAATLITGLVNSRLVIGRLWLDMSVTYHRLLLLKIAVVAVMVVLACVNRYVFVPRMVQDRARALRMLRLGTGAEVALGLLAITLVAAFGIIEPLSAE